MLRVIYKWMFQQWNECIIARNNYIVYSNICVTNTAVNKLCRCKENDACDHICRDTGVSIECACDPGYRLAPDLRSCNGKIV